MNHRSHWSELGVVAWIVSTLLALAGALIPSPVWDFID